MNAIVQLLVKHGYSVLFLSVFARRMWLPVPAILFLIAAGALADSGRMTLAADHVSVGESRVKGLGPTRHERG